MTTGKVAHPLGKHQNKPYDSQLLYLRDLVCEELGLNFTEAKMHAFQSKINSLIEKEGFSSLKELIHDLRSNRNAAWNLIIRYLTINYTYFFREDNQMALMVRQLKKKRVQEPLIWCAASSTGEEVYTIAITLFENGIRKFMILASDLDKSVLIKMKIGEYPEEKLQKLHPGLIKKYFDLDRRKKGDVYKVKGVLKKYVIAKQLNLLGNLVFEKQFDFIFCRNVLIYFHGDTRRKVIVTLLNNLKQDGELFLGQSESLVGTGIHLTQIGPSVYKKG